MNVFRLRSITRMWSMRLNRSVALLSLFVVFFVVTTLYISQFTEFFRDRRVSPCQLAAQLNVAFRRRLQHDSDFGSEQRQQQNRASSRNDSLRVSEPELIGDVLGGPPGSVYFVWCGSRRRQFEFRNYLSVLSAVRILRPDNVWFYYDHEPTMDGWMYNTWLKELSEQFPFFHRRSLNDVIDQSAGAACDGESPSASFIYALVTARGGTYLDDETVLVNLDERQRRLDVVAAFSSDSGSGSSGSRRLRFLMAKPAFPCTDTALQSIVAGGRGGFRNPVVHVTECSSVDALIATSNSSSSPSAAADVCVEMKDSLFPKDIWTLENRYGHLLRSIFYGQPEVRLPKASSDQLAPNIGHVIWIGGGQMSFFFFLGVLSLIHVAKVDVVYVHGDLPPTGRYWKLLVDTRQPVRFVLRENAAEVFGQRVGDLSHVSDTWRADILFKYGGVYMDTDAIFVRPLDAELRSYDAVASFDWVDWYPPFPDIVNLGVTIGKPGARFWQLCLESMRWFEDGDWTWNGLRQPYRIMERHPDLLHVEPRLQVICYYSKCHPTWWPDYHNKRVHHRSPPVNQPPLSWKNDAYVFHFTHPVPSEFYDEQTLMRADGMIAEIGRNVLQASDMIKHLEL